jgi:hypothetical protein
MGLDQQARIAWPTPAERDYRSPNLKPYAERGGQMKGEQLQNFVEHFLPDQEMPTPGGTCLPNIPSSSRPDAGSTGSAMDSEIAVYCQWAQQAWSRQGRIGGSMCSATGSGEDSSDDTSEDPSEPVDEEEWTPEKRKEEARLEKKRRKLWAYRQRTMGWANPLKWTRPAFWRRLNPEFVDALMNWPPGWTSALEDFGPEEMELWLSRERLLLASLCGE